MMCKVNAPLAVPLPSMTMTSVCPGNSVLVICD